MDEARSSWNTVYQSKEGFECQITLRDEDEANLIRRASKVMAGIVRSGGIPVRRRNRHAEENSGKSGEKPEKLDKTYVDEKGVRRCNMRLRSGGICGSPVVEKQGRYGKFWSCPRYKEHA
jgi:hypothetical protein